MITLYNLFFFLFESRLSSSLYSSIIFLWGKCASKKERSKDLSECLKCAAVATQASPCPLLSLCGFPCFPELGSSTFLADVAA